PRGGFGPRCHRPRFPAARARRTLRPAGRPGRPGRGRRATRHAAPQPGYGAGPTIDRARAPDAGRRRADRKRAVVRTPHRAPERVRVVAAGQTTRASAALPEHAGPLRHGAETGVIDRAPSVRPPCETGHADLIAIPGDLDRSRGRCGPRNVPSGGTCTTAISRRGTE